MKGIIKKTGELVDIISFSSNSGRRNYDYINYIDSDGNEIHGEKLNYYWDVEILDDKDFIAIGNTIINKSNVTHIISQDKLGKVTVYFTGGNNESFYESEIGKGLYDKLKHILDAIEIKGGNK